MPLYEYECPDCGHVCEVIQKNLEEADLITNVPVCGHGQEDDELRTYMVRKKINTGTSFQLKGGGWYRDGYSKGKK